MPGDQNSLPTKVTYFDLGSEWIQIKYVIVLIYISCKCAKTVKPILIMVFLYLVLVVQKWYYRITVWPLHTMTNGALIFSHISKSYMGLLSLNAIKCH